MGDNLLHTFLLKSWTCRLFGLSQTTQTFEIHKIYLIQGILASLPSRQVAFYAEEISSGQARIDCELRSKCTVSVCEIQDKTPR